NGSLSTVLWLSCSEAASLLIFLGLPSFRFNWLISERIEGLLGNHALTGRRDFRFSLFQPLGRSSAPRFFALRKSLKSFNSLLDLFAFDPKLGEHFVDIHVRVNFRSS